MTTEKQHASQKKRTSSKAKWPNLYTRTHRTGQVSYVVDLGKINERRERYSFKTKEEAETYAEQARIKKLNEGIAAFTLPSHIRTDAARASDLLEPYGVTLTQAAQYYLDHVIAFRTAPSLANLITKMIAEAEENNRRPRTISDLRNRLEFFSADFPDTHLHEISLEDIKDWLGEQDWSPRTRINYLTKLSQLYNYALKHKWGDRNVVELIDRPDAEDKEPGIFTVEQAEKLLSKADDFGLLPYVALGLFAGLRASELTRIDGHDIKVEERAIIVGSSVAKKRSRRVVDMCDALVTWLQPALPLKGKIVDAGKFRDNLQSLKVAAAISEWPHNGLRHSFGSYHLAFYGDAIKTANQMGHRDSVIVHNHYKALVLKTEAERFWGLRPAAS